VHITPALVEQVLALCMADPQPLHVVIEDGNCHDDFVEHMDDVPADLRETLWRMSPTQRGRLGKLVCAASRRYTPPDRVTTAYRPDGSIRSVSGVSVWGAGSEPPLVLHVTKRL